MPNVKGRTRLSSGYGGSVYARCIVIGAVEFVYSPRRFLLSYGGISSCSHRTGHHGEVVQLSAMVTGSSLCGASLPGAMTSPVVLVVLGDQR